MARWRSPQSARPVCRAGQVRARGLDRLRQFALIALTATGIAGAQLSHATPFDHQKLAETARTTFIVPGYAALAKRLDAVETATESLCRHPSPEGLAGVRAAYRMVISAWGRVEIIMFGPVGRENRFERLFFWPDRRSIGQRQVRAILRNRDRDAIDPARLAEKSVAVQGLTALEILLHGDGSDRLATTSRDEFRCAYARAIVRNLTGIVGAIREDWADDGAFTAIWRNPGPANPAYLFGRETTLELVKAFDQALENVRDRRIAPAIGFGPLRRVHRPVLWRSRLTMPLLHANLAGAHDLFNEGGLAAAYLARMQRSQEAVSGIAGITSELKLMRDATASLAAKADPFASPDIKSRLAAIGFPLRNVRKQAVDRLKEAAGLSVGFNASDGD